jgi:uncharacterized protein (TIRG00374 family)
LKINQKTEVKANILRSMVSPRRMKLIINFLVGISALFAIWWSLKDISINAVVDNFRQVGWQAVFALILLNVFIFLLLSFRWWMMIRAQGYHISLWSIAAYRLAGFGVTYFTPGPQVGGEPLQVYLLKDRESVQLAAAAVSVTLDKLVELIANFSFLVFGVSMLVFNGVLNYSTSWSLILIPVFLLALPILYFVALRADYHPITTTLEKIEIPILGSITEKGWASVINDIEAQASRFSRDNLPVLSCAALLSVGIWALMVLEFGWMLRFLGVQLEPLQVLFALTAARIAFLMPIPAGLGTLEASQVIAMGLIGVNPLIGIGASVFIRTRDILFGAVGLGLGGFYNR